ncbi:natterin-3 [Puntigrus tetrazona]|uniref:natterin-3 n=1 Tax=Puntigrus tetrazona TaxID=1606681 RepID=UPI001C8AF831|nr:natterin-3 [Puntigrus tetrazona]
MFSVTMTGIPEKEYYIGIDKECKPCLVDMLTMTCVTSSQTAERFLVNPDEFENLEWKKIEFLKSLLFPVETCKGLIIARNKNDLGYIKANILKSFGSYDEFLSLNHGDIKEEYLSNIEFNVTLLHRNKKPDLFRNLTIVNNNCEVMKQQVKIDNNFEETSTYEVGNTLLIGGSVGFKILDIDLGLKVEHTSTETETKSNIKKNDYGYVQDLEIPRLSSCTLVINSNVLVTSVPFTADLTRVFNNYETRTTSISGNYTYEKSAEVKTNFENCVKLHGECKP